MATPEKVRKPRADAQKNRDAILAAARQTFETDGVMAPLDGIAALAGVGNATLYRNFPTRDDLLVEIIQSSFEAALSEGRALSETLPPGQALSEWLVGLAWQLRIWHDLPYCLASAHAEPGGSLNESNRPLIEETDRLLQRALAAGQAADNVTAEEIYELILALSWAIDRYGDDAASARRRVLIAIAGICGRAS